jgi:hypothetical protein
MYVSNFTQSVILLLPVQAVSFPDQYRRLAWRFLLRLPSNTGAFDDLCARGVHPCWADLGTRYPVRDRRLMSRLTKAGGGGITYASKIESMPLVADCKCAGLLESSVWGTTLPPSARLPVCEILCCPRFRKRRDCGV